jgi:hypothetical protein
MGEVIDHTLGEENMVKELGNKMQMENGKYPYHQN